MIGGIHKEENKSSKLNYLLSYSSFWNGNAEFVVVRHLSAIVICLPRLFFSCGGSTFGMKSHYVPVLFLSVSYDMNFNLTLYSVCIRDRCKNEYVFLLSKIFLQKTHSVPQCTFNYIVEFGKYLLHVFL